MNYMQLILLVFLGHLSYHTGHVCVIYECVYFVFNYLQVFMHDLSKVINTLIVSVVLQ